MHHRYWWCFFIRLFIVYNSILPSENIVLKPRGTDCKQCATVFTIPTQFITNHEHTHLVWCYAPCLILSAKIAIIERHRMRFKVLFLFLMSIYTFIGKTISNLYGRTLISSTFNKPIKRLFNLTTTPLFNAA